MNAPTHRDPLPSDTAYGCLDFRREKLADPKRLSQNAHAHLATCALCQAYAQRVDVVEERAAAQLAVPIPEGLADRIILGATRRKGWNWRLYALAASVLLSVAIGLEWIALPLARSNATPALYAIEHVLHEPDALHAHRDISPSRIQAVLASVGGELRAPLGKVRFIKLCPVPGGTGWHIVFETPQGLATLLLVPTDSTGMRAGTAAEKGLNALVEPAGFGYYAIITATPDALQSADQSVRQSIRWL